MKKILAKSFGFADCTIQVIRGRVMRMAWSN